MDAQLTGGSTQYCSGFLVENAIANRTAEHEGNLERLEVRALSESDDINTAIVSAVDTFVGTLINRSGIFFPDKIF